MTHRTFAPSVRKRARRSTRLGAYPGCPHKILAFQFLCRLTGIALCVCLGAAAEVLRIAFEDKGIDFGYDHVAKAPRGRMTFRVLDTAGSMISGLTKSNFFFFENAVAADLETFDNITSTERLAVSLVIDTSRSITDAGAEDTMTSSAGSLESSVNADFRYYQFASQVSELDDLSALQFSATDRFTSLYDAVWQAIEDDRDRILVLFSDGRDNYSDRSLEDALRLIAERKVRAFAVALASPRSDTLERLASYGGVAYAPTVSDLPAAFLEIARRLNSIYTVSYWSPSRDDAHEIAFRVEQDGNRSQTLIARFCIDGSHAESEATYTSGDRAPEQHAPHRQIDHGRPEFSWSVVPGATWYQLFLRKRDAWDWSTWLEGEPMVRWLSEAWVLDDGDYQWWIRTWSKESGYGVWSGDRSFDIRIADISRATPRSPRDLETLETQRPQFTWEPARGASWHQLFLRKEGAWDWSTWMPQRSSWAPVTQGLENGDYTWWVRGWNSQSGVGQWSDAEQFRVDVIPLAKPVLHSPSGTINGRRVPFAWSPVDDATLYRLWIQRNDGSRVWDLWVEDATLWEMLDWELQPGDYTWWVQAWDADRKTGPWSDGMPFTVSNAPAEYIVVDLSSGPAAASYPVTFAYDVPDFHTNPDVYRTVRLLLRRVPAGSFTMGSPSSESARDVDEGPQHTVTFSTDIYLGVFELTQRQWELVMGTRPSHYAGEPWHTKPVETVSYEAILGTPSEGNSSQQIASDSFMGQLRTKTGLAIDLPNEAQWEYAARGGPSSTGYLYSGNNNADSVAWYADNAVGTQIVGTKEANEAGLYDMSGNVWEWCLDWYDSAYYGASSVGNPSAPVSGAEKVHRGGSWNYRAPGCRVANRGSALPVFSHSSIGFRVAIALDAH